MIRFEVQIDALSRGWATVLVHTKDRILKIPCSYLGGDTLGQLAEAFAQLSESKQRKIEVDCYGEPENSLIALRRSGGELEVTIKRFQWEGDGAPEHIRNRACSSGKRTDWEQMKQARNKKARLRQRGPFVEAMRSLVQSFQHIEDQIGGEQYERAWGFAFPSAELAEMKKFLFGHSLNGGEGME